MSVRTGTATLVCAFFSTILVGISPASAESSSLEGAAIEVIVRDEVAAGEAPSFELVETNISGLVGLVVGANPGQSVELHTGAQVTWEPSDPYASSQWGNELMGLPAAWDVSRGDRSVVIAVLDTGVDSAADLGDRLLGGASFIGGDAHVDPAGHGTWVATVAAASHDDQGIAGVCSQCSILPVQVADASGYVPWAAAAEGIVYAVDAGADIINLSFGGEGQPAIMGDALAYAAASGVIVIAAAGNAGTDTEFFPAASPGVIGVAAHDEYLQRYSWSSHGQWVDVSAPGCSIGLVGDTYATICGTSFASPWISGLVGLLIADRGPLTSTQAEAHLESVATNVDWVETGWVNASAAVGQITTTPTGTFTDVAPTAYYANAVTWLVDNQITTGTSATTFSPESVVTRGQLAAFLWRLDGAAQS